MNLCTEFPGPASHLLTTENAALVSLKHARERKIDAPIMRMRMATQSPRTRAAQSSSPITQSSRDKDYTKRVDLEKVACKTEYHAKFHARGLGFSLFVGALTDEGLIVSLAVL